MRVVTIILIVVALAVAGVTAYLVNQFLNETAEEANRPPEVIEEAKVEVLVAAVDLPIGKIIRSEDVRWQSWPEDSLGPDYIVRGMSVEGEAESRETLTDVEGTAVRVEIVAGEPIIPGKLFHRGDSGFLSGVLGPGMRAVTVSVNPETGNGGFVLPGDHVDLVVVFEVLDTDDITGDVTQRTVAETIIENVRVLAIDQAVASRTRPGDEGGGSETVADLAETVTLEVTPNQAQAIAVADQFGRIRLMLRSAIEGELSEDRQRFSPDYAVSDFLSRRVPDSARVLVASHNVGPGTLLSDRDWIWLDMPQELIEDGWVREAAMDLDLLRGALTLAGIEAGEPIVPEQLITPGQDGYITAQISDGMRAITVALDEERAVSAFVAPGDFVDVIYNYEMDVDYGGDEPYFEKSPRRFSETLLENVRVLYIDREFAPGTGMPELESGTETVTLEVTPAQAELLIVAREEGLLNLVLRGDSPGEATRLADYTSDFDTSRSMVELIYGLTMPPPPAALREQYGLTDGAAPADDGAGDEDSDAASDDFLDLDDYLDGLDSGSGFGDDGFGASDGARSSGEVRVYRSTEPQDLDFNE